MKEQGEKVEMRRFLFAAVPCFGFIFGFWALSSLTLSDAISLLGVVFCVTFAIGLTIIGTKRTKVRTKQKDVSFALIVNDKTYQVK